MALLFDNFVEGVLQIETDVFLIWLAKTYVPLLTCSIDISCSPNLPDQQYII